MKSVMLNIIILSTSAIFLTGCFGGLDSLSGSVYNPAGPNYYKMPDGSDWSPHVNYGKTYSRPSSGDCKPYRRSDGSWANCSRNK